MNTALIDLRPVPPLDRHPLIFSTFDALPVGQCLEIVHNHDPFPLRDQFHRARPRQFSWQYLAEGPGQWRVHIGRVAQAAPAEESASPMLPCPDALAASRRDCACPNDA